MVSMIYLSIYTHLRPRAVSRGKEKAVCMKKITAFSYLYQYYALPEEYSSAEAFLAAAARRPAMTLVHLRETDCVAPYFIEENTEVVRLKLARPQRIHPMEAYLLSAEEYGQRLAELTAARCPGCYYHDHPDDEGGHGSRAKEMTLDGLCLLRTEEKPYSLIDAADSFWADLLDGEDAVRKPLFDGNLTEAADALSVIYGRHFSCASHTLFAVNRAVGQRYLMFGALSPEARVVNRYVITRAPKEVTEYWMLFDQLLRGLSRYIPVPGYDLNQSQPTVEYSPLEGSVGRWQLKVYAPPAAGGVQAPREVYRWLCACLGEDLLFTRAAELNIEVTADYASHRPLSDFIRDLRRGEGLFFLRKVAKAFAHPMELVLPPDNRGSRSTAERISTVAPALSVELTGRVFSGYLARVIDEWRIPVCTLALDLAEPSGREAQLALVCGELVRDLQRDGLIALLDIAQAEDKLYLNFFAAAGGETVEALRDLAPEFAGMNPTLTLRTHKETAMMHLNFTLDPIRRVGVEREVAYES